MSMKRTRPEFEAINVDDFASVANYLMILSRTTTTNSVIRSQQDRIFECKTCNRRFTSFQALGGHRASHKKPKLSGAAQSSSENNSSISNDNTTTNTYSSKPKKKHECSICGAEFALGQALGGHMRRHRVASGFASGLVSTDLSLSLDTWRPQKVAEKVVVISDKSTTTTLCLDLCL